MSSLLSHFPQLKLRTRSNTKLRTGKRLRFSSGCISWGIGSGEASGSKRQAVEEDDQAESEPPCDATAMEKPVAKRRSLRLWPEAVAEPEDGCPLLEMPNELLDGAMVDVLDYKDICNLAQTCKRFRTIAVQERRWKAYFEARWGPVNHLMETAAKLAGGWRALFAAKHVVELEAAPWVKPTMHELAAAVEGIVDSVSGQPKEGEQEAALQRNVLFLVDGSGSVTEEDFNNMTSFMNHAWKTISQSCPGSKVGILQFSNDVRVELQPQALDADGFCSCVSKLSRMNGGTNISAAIRKAGQILTASKGANAWHAVVLLTDGRVDGYQATEAVEMAARLADELGNLAIHAFGVGRGVDRTELLRIIGTAGPGGDDNRYLGLCTFEDAPW